MPRIGLMYKINGSMQSCENMFYRKKLKGWWERQYLITAGKHMQQNMTVVLRCGEHSYPCMYVEHGAWLPLEGTGCGRG